MSFAALARVNKAAPAKAAAKAASKAVTMGEPNDAFEQEADRISDAVLGGRKAGFQWSLSGIDVHPTLRRKCDCGGSGECESCKAKKTLQRKAGGPAVAGETVPSSVHEILGSPGRPLDAATRDFFEPRFGHDFSTVRVHADAQAAESARAVNALAYTVGNHVVFGPGRYAPESPEGKKLLAHELTHTVQQGGQEALTGPAPHLQRAVSPELAQIRRDLSTGFLDWMVTESESHDALDRLNRVGAADFADTVAAMDREGLVDTLFNHISDDDRHNRGALLQRIQDHRAYRRTGPTGATTTTGSCPPERQRVMDSKIATTKQWARQCKEEVDRFLSPVAFNDPAVTGITTRLDRHFFHQERAGTLSATQQAGFAHTIRNNFEAVEQQVNPLPNSCAVQFDSLCSSLAQAYVDQTSRRVMFCPSYFDAGDIEQTTSLFHELFHAYGTAAGSGVSDTGYGGERIYRYLPPTDAVNNADSYAMFARDTVSGAGSGGAASYRRALADSIADCSEPQQRELQRSFAFGQRMITNSLNVIGDFGLLTSPHYSTIANRHFKTTQPTPLQRVVDRFRDLRGMFQQPVNFECETSCSEPMGYHHTLGSTAHVCPGFFALASEDARRDNLLLILEGLGLHIHSSAEPGTPAYAAQSADQAYENASSYLAYAKEVTSDSGDWRFNDASSRYPRDGILRFDDEKNRLLEGITETDSLRAHIGVLVGSVRQDMEAAFTATPTQNAGQSQTQVDRYLNELRDLMALSQTVSDRYLHFTVEADSRSLVVEPRFQTAYGGITHLLKERFQSALLNLLGPQAQQIQTGQRVARNPWPEVEALNTQYLRALGLIEGYLPVARRSQEVGGEYDSFATRLSRTARRPRQRDAIEDRALIDMFSLNNDMDRLRSTIVDRLLAGTAFGPGSGLNPDQVLRRYERELRETSRNPH